MSFPSHFRHRRVLITGGLGFLGSSLARRLTDNGAEVTLVDNLLRGSGALSFNIAAFADRVQVHHLDLVDSDALEPIVHRQDFIFNLAGRNGHLESMTDPKGDLKANLEAHIGLLEACRRSQTQAPIVFTSTRQIYGTAEQQPVNEEHPIRPPDVNGCHNLAAEHLHRVYGQAYGLLTTTLRLTATYGPRMFIRDASNGFLGSWIRQILAGEPLGVFGDGKQQRDFNFVDDVLDALLAVAIKPQEVGATYNLGASSAISVAQLAQTLIEAHGSGAYQHLPFPKDRLPIEIGDFRGDYQRLHNHTGWQPSVSLIEGLGRTLDYYREHLAQYL